MAGASLTPWYVGLVGGAAAALGETTGYLAGYSGSTMAAKWRMYPRVAIWVDRWGGLTIFMRAVLPGPLVDLAGIAAGTVCFPFAHSLLLCWAGKIVQFLIMAWAGYAMEKAGYF